MKKTLARGGNTSALETGQTTDSVVKLSTSIAPPGTGDFTWGCWFYIKSWNTNHTQNSLICLGGSSDANKGFRTAIYETGYVWTTISDGTTKTIPITHAGVIELYRWYHLVIVYNRASDCQIYVNAVDKVRDDFKDITASYRDIDTLSYYYHGTYSGTGRELIGYTDDIRYYRRALSQDEVKLWYQGVEISNKDLELHIPFNENTGTTAHDISGNGNHSTLLNNAGWVDKGISFDGVDSHIGFSEPKPWSEILGGDDTIDFSVSLWVKFNKDNLTGNINGLLGSYADAGSNGMFIVLREDGKYSIRLKGSDAESTYFHRTSAGEVGNNEWRHIVVSFDRNGLARMYIDANSDRTGDISDHTGSLDTHFYIGRIHNWYSESMLYDVRVYNKVLSQEEINNLYNGTDITTGLVSRWKLDEKYGDTAYDSVGSNDGTLVNNPIWHNVRPPVNPYL